MPRGIGSQTALGGRHAGDARRRRRRGGPAGGWVLPATARAPGAPPRPAGGPLIATGSRGSTRPVRSWLGGGADGPGPIDARPIGRGVGAGRGCEGAPRPGRAGPIFAAGSGRRGGTDCRTLLMPGCHRSSSTRAPASRTKTPAEDRRRRPDPEDGIRATRPGLLPGWVSGRCHTSRIPALRGPLGFHGFFRRRGRMRWASAWRPTNGCFFATSLDSTCDPSRR
jgi:hypothetical protein